LLHKKSQITKFLFLKTTIFEKNEKVLQTLFVPFLLLSLFASSTSSSLLSPPMPLTPPFVDTEFKKEKSLYLREPLFQFFGLCTIVEKRKKKREKSNINTK